MCESRLTRRQHLGWCLALPALASQASHLGTQGDMHVFDVPARADSGLRSRLVQVFVPRDLPADEPAAVLVMHDGQNLFDARRSYSGVAWAADRALADGIRSGQLRPTLIVAIDNTADRWNEYLPQGPLSSWSPAQVADLGGRYARPVGLLADAYLEHVLDAVLPHIGRRFHIDPAEVFLMGSSMGGLVSLYGLLRYPDRFRGAAGLSTHWPLGDTAIARPLLQRAWQQWRAWMQAHLPAPGRHLIYMDHGDQGLDALYSPYQAEVDALFAARGWSAQSGLRSVAVPGTGHSEAAWQARLFAPMQHLLSRPHRRGRS